MIASSPQDLKLLTLAGAWRAAMERCDLSDVPVFARFPRGSCGNASIVLCRFLEKHGVTGLEYVVGRRLSGERVVTHAWLEVDMIIVDITADQFDDHPAPKIIVTPDRGWHASFPEEDRHEIRTGIYGEQKEAEYESWYLRILEVVEPKLRPCGCPESAARTSGPP